MTEMKQGNVTISIPDSIEIPDKAGEMSPEEVRRLPKARHGIGLTSGATAEAMDKDPERLAPHGVDKVRLAKLGEMAENIDNVIVDVEAITVRLKQANLLIDAEAHEELRKVLAFVRSQEKFDARILDLVPQLITYFSKNK